MNKIFLIIKREYLTRVRKRTFIISTILFPVLYLGLVFGAGYIASKSGTNLRVAVIDSSGYFNKGVIERENLADSSSVLELVSTNPADIKNNFKDLGYDGYVIIPASLNWESNVPGAFTLFTSRTLGVEGTRPVQNKLNNIWNSIKNEKLGIDENKKKILESNTINIVPVNIHDTNSNSGIATMIGYISGFLIYIILLLYGSQVMTSVMEEKTNRIAEVIVSSVKPFQLMLGKIIGVSLVALTQFLLWITFIFVIYNVTKTSGSAGPMGDVVGGMQKVFTSINVPLIIFCFIFYLLGGFFFYSSLYAAIGSAANESMQEAQSLGFPVTMLVIISLTLMTAIMRDPNGPLAVWGSIIPFSSSIIMMARIPFGVPGTVPWWQLGTSMTALIAGFIFTTWFAGKIYRTGILMYGKKPTWKEMIRWAFRKS